MHHDEYFSQRTDILRAMADAATFRFPDMNYRSPPALAYQVWFGGGQVALYSASKCQLDHTHGLNELVFASLQSLQLDKLFSCLSTCGLPILGITAYQLRDEFTGRRVPLFMAWQDAEYWWGAKQAHDRWNMVSHGAEVASQTRLADLADRLACAVDECQTHLQNLCKAYAVQLGAQDAETWELPSRCFSDSHSQAVYPAIHSFFWQLAVLRDLLAEFAAGHIFGHDGIATYKGLLDKLKRDSTPDPDLAVKLRAAGGAEGWISVFTSYRNLFTHAASLRSVQGVHHTYQDTRTLYTRSVPQLYYPLPRDPELLVRQRSSGSATRTPTIPIEPTEPNRSHEPDALEYLASTFDRFVQLAIALSLRSPVEPQMPTLTDEDIIEFKGI